MTTCECNSSDDDIYSIYDGDLSLCNSCSLPCNGCDFMISCDECNSWHHGACVSISLEEARVFVQKKTITTLALSALCQWFMFALSVVNSFNPKSRMNYGNISIVFIFFKVVFLPYHSLFNIIVGFVLSHLVIGHLIGALLNWVVRGPSDRLVAVTHCLTKS